jgi:hypothetical protein
VVLADAEMGVREVCDLHRVENVSTRSEGQAYLTACPEGACVARFAA